MSKKPVNQTPNSRPGQNSPGNFSRSEPVDPGQAGTSEVKNEFSKGQEVNTVHEPGAAGKETLETGKTGTGPSGSGDKSLGSHERQSPARGKGADAKIETSTSGRGIPESPRASIGGRGLDGARTPTQGLPSGDGSIKGLSGVKSLVSSAWKTTVGKMALVGTGIVATAAVTLGIISSINNPDLSGTWEFHTDETGECGHTYDGWTVPVWQKGKTFSGNYRPQPVITDGRISGSEVTFSIIVNPEDDYGDGNFTDLSGTLEGNVITGTLSGHNGGNTCFWEGNFTVTIREE